MFKGIFQLTFIFIILLAVENSNAQYLTTSGQNINDRDGNPIILKGVGLGGWMLQEPYMMNLVGGASNQKEFRIKLQNLIGQDQTDEFFDSWLDNFVTKKDIDSIASWGFNSVRIPMHYNLFTLPIEEENGNENTWLSKGFEIVDELLTWCEENELYLILDLHAAPGGQGYDEAISDYDPNFPSLWESDLNQQKTIALWGKLAERYHDKEWIGGYDLLNETNWNLNGSDMRDLYIQITDAIRYHDQNHIIFIEGNWFANDFTGLTPPWDNNMVYSFHKYWNINTQNTIQWVLDMRNQYNVPLWMGESGENSNVWFKEAISLFESNNIGWAWWPWKRLETTVSSYSIHANDNYNQLVGYFKGEVPMPDPDLAYQGLMDLASAAYIDNCDYRKDVIDAMLRQPNSNEIEPYKTHPIPGLILATHYDLGSQGYAYNDNEYGNYSLSGGTSSWNLGWVFRNDGVDITTQNSDSSYSNGYSIGYVQDREWIKYTVEVEQSGYYDIQTSYSADNSGGKIQFELNDIHLTPLTDLSATGGFSNFGNASSQTAYIDSGTHTLKVRIVGDVEFNLEAFTISFSSNQSPAFSEIGAIIDENDQQIRLVLNKYVSSSVLNPENFQVLSNEEEISVSSVALDNENDAVILINLSSSLSFYDDITIGYSSGDILSVDNEQLSDFSTLTVQNLLDEINIIPGKIEAERYDTQFGIGTENTTDVGLGLNIKDLHPGDFATYEVDVKESGTYLFQYRVATERENSSFSLTFTQGEQVIYYQTYSFDGTESWQIWQTGEDELFLENGKYSLIFKPLDNEFNLNWINFEMSNDNSRQQIPGLIEAESFDEQFGMTVSNVSDVGGGQQLGYLDNGDYAIYSVQIQNEGTYAIKNRVSSNYNDPKFLFELEKSDGLTFNVALVEHESTGGWSNWETVEELAVLPKGNYNLKMTSTGSATNLNWYDFEYLSSSMQPISIPNKIEAENYFGYKGVGTENCFDSGGGKNLNYIDPGDYTTYNVSVSQTGYYTVKARLSGYNVGLLNLVLSTPNTSDQTLHTFNTPATNGWQNWQTVEADVLIKQGEYTLTMNVQEGEFNVNWFDFVYDPDGGIQIPGVLESEDYWEQEGLSIENCFDQNGGYNLSYMNQGDYAKYLVHVVESGIYKVKARVSSNYNGGIFNLVLSGDSSDEIVLNNFQVPNTGGWQSWQTIEKEFEFSQGSYELTMNVLGNEFNLNWIEFEFVEPLSNDDIRPIRLTLHPNPSSGTIVVNSEVPIDRIEIFSLQGKLINRIFIDGKSQFSMQQNLSNGLYLLKFNNDIVKQLLIQN